LIYIVKAKISPEFELFLEESEEDLGFAGASLRALLKQSKKFSLKLKSVRK